MKLISVFVSILGLTIASEIVRYDGFKVYELITQSIDEINLLEQFDYDENYDFWSKHLVPQKPIVVMVSPNAQDYFESFLSSHNIDYEIINNNVEETVQKERDLASRSARVESGDVSFTEFMRHDEILAYLDALAERYPNTVTKELIGKSFEGRDLTLIRISSGGSNKPLIFADATIHAREWIAPSMALYVINQLVENPVNSYLYENVDWAIIPVANPDGYEYTHNENRFWRKTRSPGALCFGADPNRNFGYHWMESGSSAWQCSDIYAGFSAFSEVETQAMRDYIHAHVDDIKLYIAIHSYGNWVLYPWSYDRQVPDNAAQLQEVGELFHNAANAVNGNNFTVGNSAALLGTTAGCSDDYAKSIGIPLSYTLELPGGGTGFDPPASDILGMVEESWEGFKAFHQYVENTYGTK